MYKVLFRASVVALVVGVCGLSFFRSASVQAQTATPAATSPEIPALQTQVSGQATQIAALEESQKTTQTTITIASLVVAVFAALGISVTAYNVFKYAREQSQKLIDKAIYKIDPASAIIRVPRDAFTTELKHLRWRGFHKTREYKYLDESCTEDCVVVVAKTDQDITDFRAFLQQYKPGVEKVAYVIYTQLRVPPDIVSDFPNITFANSLVALGTNVYTIARSLIR